MRRKIHLSIMQFSIILAIAILTTTITVLAASGTTDAPNAPALTSSYTLEDIYQRLVNGTNASQGTFTEPAVAPGTGSMHTLNNIMSAAPALDNTNGATANQVLQNRTFWGLTNGQWGLQTGSMPVRSNVTGTDGQLAFIIPDGYYYHRSAIATDSDLLAGNILDGVEIFGVTGNIPTGSDVTGANGLITFDIPDGYYASRTATASDNDLLAGNILAGTNIFGVEGERHGGCVCNGHMVGDTGTRWCDNEDGTITDMQNACLIWLKNAGCLGQDIWDNANIKVSSLDSGQCGLSDGSDTYDWRLPTREEMTILTHGIDNVQSSTPQGFTGVQNEYYWTGTISTTDSDFALVYNVATLIAGSSEKTLPYYVWAVRNDY